MAAIDALVQDISALLTSENVLIKARNEISLKKQRVEKELADANQGIQVNLDLLYQTCRALECLKPVEEFPKEIRDYCEREFRRERNTHAEK